MTFFKAVYYILVGGIALIAIFLIVSILPIPGNYEMKIVLSGSMEPAIKTGSIIIVKPESDYRIGDVISFGKDTKKDIPTTHRIYDIKVNGGKEYYITKGDANNASDSREISKKQIIGKVVLDIPYLGYIIAEAKQPIGFALIIIIPALIIIFDESRKIYGEIKRKKKAKNEEI